MLAPHSALYHHRGEEAHRDTCAHSAIPNATHRPCYWICDWGKILHREARASVSRPPLPSHLLPAYVRNRHVRLQELALPLTGGPGRGGAGSEASVDKLCIHPPLLYDLSICPHGDGGGRSMMLWKSPGTLSPGALFLFVSSVSLLQGTISKCRCTAAVEPDRGTPRPVGSPLLRRGSLEIPGPLKSCRLGEALPQGDGRQNAKKKKKKKLPRLSFFV
ncbi:hypothetical protein NQZ68_023099 [Dissostichus eleginoides]|nr:hypothetical protein NQZ68_023099 [Dissostichus eleginoides]